MKLPDEPRPVPAGMSASVVISSCGVRRSHQPHRLADDRVLHLVDASTCSSFEYLRIMPGVHGRCDRDVDVLVDRRGDQEAAVLAVVRRQVGAAAAERDPERAARDDHRSGALV